MKDASPPALCVACSIFREQLEDLRAAGAVDLELRFVDSMLHMRPARLAQVLDHHLAKVAEAHRPALLLWGDCHPDMALQQVRPGVTRVRGINCVEILLGRERYRTLRAEGVFFAMPEWALRWREIFRDELGLEEEVARELMGEMHTRIVYLQTDDTSPPADVMQAFSHYTGLPWEVLRTDLEPLRAAVVEAVEELQGHGHRVG